MDTQNSLVFLIFELVSVISIATCEAKEYTFKTIWVLVGTLDRDHDCSWIMGDHVEV